LNSETISRRQNKKVSTAMIYLQLSSSFPLPTFVPRLESPPLKFVEKNQLRVNVIRHEVLFLRQFYEIN